MKKIGLFAAAFLTVIYISIVISASSVTSVSIKGLAAKETTDVQPGCLQFVDPSGSPVPYLYVYWDKHPNFNDYVLPTGDPTGPDGVWTPPYALMDGENTSSFHKTFTVKNLFGGVYQFEKTYEVDLLKSQTAPIKLIWDKELPLRSLSSSKHKLVIHIQDEKANPIPGATVQLLKPNFSDQTDFRFSGTTDSKGNYYTNLHDDLVYTVTVRCSDSKLEIIDREYQLDASKGGAISKTYIIKDRNKEYIRYF